jgi:hypothetical protein
MQLLLSTAPANATIAQPAQTQPSIFLDGINAGVTVSAATTITPAKLVKEKRRATPLVHSQLHNPKAPKQQHRHAHSY